MLSVHIPDSQPSHGDNRSSCTEQGLLLLLPSHVPRPACCCSSRNSRLKFTLPLQTCTAWTIVKKEDTAQQMTNSPASMCRIALRWSLGQRNSLEGHFFLFFKSPALHVNCGCQSWGLKNSKGDWVQVANITHPLVDCLILQVLENAG